MSDANPHIQRLEWKSKGVEVSDVVAKLSSMYKTCLKRGNNAAARSLNLVIAPLQDEYEKRAVISAIAGQLPSRMIILQRHQEDRLDAEVEVVCVTPRESGRIGFCYDRITLLTDNSRLSHIQSLLSPLLGSLTSTIVWVSQHHEAAIERSLAKLADQLVIDTGYQQPELSLKRAAKLTRTCRVHDIMWGRVSWWRTRIASAFDDREVLDKLPLLKKVEIHYGVGWPVSALLLAGWIAARLDFTPERFQHEIDGYIGYYRKTDISPFTFELKINESPDSPSISSIVFHFADETNTKLDSEFGSDQFRDNIIEALRPIPRFTRGYRDTLKALHPLYETDSNA